MPGRLNVVFLVSLMAGMGAAAAQTPPAPAQPMQPGNALHPPRPVPPLRDPNTPGYVKATELPDGTVPSPTADGNFILGPTHGPAPEVTAQAGVPQGTVYEFTMSSADSKFYPGIARDPDTFGTADPKDPTKMIVTTSHPAPYTRHVGVYVPKQYVPGTAAPFIVGEDGIDHGLFTALDNLIAEHRLPVMIAISIGNGSGDAQGSERGLEYDTMSGKYAEFVETGSAAAGGVEVQREADQGSGRAGDDGREFGRIVRAGDGVVSPGALSPRADVFRDVCESAVAASNPETPHGAWEFHEHLIPGSPAKPMRIWMEVGDRDNFNPNAMRDNMHDWVVANENMAKVLAAKGYHYQFVFARNAGHTDRAVHQQTLPEALDMCGRAYPIAGK